jgi:hypothetical protein
VGAAHEDPLLMMDSLASSKKDKEKKKKDHGKNENEKTMRPKRFSAPDKVDRAAAQDEIVSRDCSERLVETDQLMDADHNEEPILMMEELKNARKERKKKKKDSLHSSVKVRDKSKERHTSRERTRDKSSERHKSRERTRDKSRERHKSTEKSRDKSRERHKSRERTRDKSRERHKSRRVSAPENLTSEEDTGVKSTRKLSLDERILLKKQCSVKDMGQKRVDEASQVQVDTNNMTLEERIAMKNKGDEKKKPKRTRNKSKLLSSLKISSSSVDTILATNKSDRKVCSNSAPDEYDFDNDEVMKPKRHSMPENERISSSEREADAVDMDCSHRSSVDPHNYDEIEAGPIMMIDSMMDEMKRKGSKPGDRAKRKSTWMFKL